MSTTERHDLCSLPGHDARDVRAHAPTAPFTERFVLDPGLVFTPDELAARRAASALPEPDERVSRNLLALDGESNA